MTQTRSTFLYALLAVAALALFAASKARGEDAFYFESSTGIPFWGANMDELEEECWFGATGNLVEGKASEDGSIRSENDNPFDGCSAAWGANMAYSADGGSIGAFGFNAFDPLVGSSTVSCEANGSEWEEGNFYTPIESFMSVEADGTSCTVKWLPGVGPSSNRRLLAASGWHSRMVDSLAPVSGGKARVSVQVFGKGQRSVRDEVTLRTRSGTPIGSGEGSSRVGARSRPLLVPLAWFARKRLAEKRELAVRATLTRADGSPGSGDQTRSLVLRAAAK